MLSFIGFICLIYLFLNARLVLKIKMIDMAFLFLITTVAAGLYIANHSLLTLLVASIIPIFLIGSVNNKITGIKIITAMGFVMNALVIVTNGGRMAYSSEALKKWGSAQILDPWMIAWNFLLDNGGKMTSAVYTGNSSPSLIFLSDRFCNPFVLAGIYSLGDILIWSGIVLAAIQVRKFKRMALMLPSAQ